MPKEKITSDPRPFNAHLEDGLHLVKLGPGMLPGEHLDDQAPDAPYIGLLRVRDLLDDLGGHPID